jgi:hypothetical protein
MPCRYANLIREPHVYEVTQHSAGYWQGNKYVKADQELLFPEWNVSLSYDYGFCCGVDGHTETFSSREEAQALIDQIHANEHEWITYDPDLIEEDSDE